MNKCNYIFSSGINKGERCNKNCKQDKCGKHSLHAKLSRQRYYKTKKVIRKRKSVFINFDLSDNNFTYILFD